MRTEKRKKGGRIPKKDPAVFRYTVRFSEEEHNRFLSDKTQVDYYTKLSDFHAQFRAIGTNYNQIVKELKSHFSEKKAMALLFKLEKCTQELVMLSHRIVQLSKDFEERWSQKSQ